MHIQRLFRLIATVHFVVMSLLFYRVKDINQFFGYSRYGASLYISFSLLSRQAFLSFVHVNYRLDAVFEKTCEATQQNVKSHVFLDFEKKT